MIAKEKWQVKTIAVLERVFEERKAQIAKHGEAMRDLPSGTGPEVPWVFPLDDAPAVVVQKVLREDYEDSSAEGRLTRMHLVREELAEAFELDQNDPEFVDELLQVAALCVQWAEYLIEDPLERLQNK